MRFVLDATVTITWAMCDEDHPLAELAFSALEMHGAAVPSIWWYEIRNILVINERRGRITASDVARFLAELAQFDIAVDAPDNSDLVIGLARKHALSVYDAAYLALAMKEHLPLATLDKNLETATIAEGIELLR